ncbi:MAG TPA: CPXCG motif-containing cysteine-rich protein [Gammaproteobacteria bacterium]|nr:CPXCG motif-containing cysteine-rich protein [Gammaproteobacteria bacterium]
MLDEHHFSCPYCGESISMMLDLSIKEQTYIEDCEVCCRPIELSYRSENNFTDDFKYGRADE